MRSLFQSSIRSLDGLLHLLACVVSIVMLVSFAIPKSHDFGNHFRSPGVRRTTARNIVLAHTYDGTCQRVAHGNVQPALFAPIHLDRQIIPLIPLENLALAFQAPLPRLLCRLKLHSANSGLLDPPL